MQLEEVKRNMRNMANIAQHAGTCSCMVLTSTGNEAVVLAKSNRIGFVYWTYDGQPTPRKALEALLQTCERVA